MRKTILIFPVLLCCFLFTPRAAQAQLEAKIGPVGLLFGGISLGVEYGFNDSFGTELHTFFGGDGGIVWATGRYYLNPREGLDRFHLGIFMAGGTDVGAGVGFMLGQKIISKNNILFDVGIGLGRSFESEFIPYGKIQVGYRFGR